MYTDCTYLDKQYSGYRSIHLNPSSNLIGNISSSSGRLHNSALEFFGSEHRSELT